MTSFWTYDYAGPLHSCHLGPGLNCGFSHFAIFT